MKIVFASNIMSHHLLPLSNELKRLSNDQFIFIATQPIENVNVSKGYADLNKSSDYILRTYESEDNYRKAIRIIDEADIVIIGSAPYQLVKERISKNKLTFKYSERLYKNEPSRIKRVYHMIKYSIQYPNKGNCYLLCASAFCATDYERIGVFKSKRYKWGYFPPLIEYDLPELLSKKEKNKILWCGRFLDWKHPDEALMVAVKLKENNVDFLMEFIGDGPIKSSVIEMAKRFGVNDVVIFHESMTPEEVRKKMEEAGVFLFTSDRYEGWGAVLNEAMNSGCAVVASHIAGSVPYLIKDNYNGCIYKNGDINDLYLKVKYLICNPNSQDRCGENAYYTIINTWNAQVAARRLIMLAKNLIDHKAQEIYEEGPCTLAKTNNA